MESEKEIQTEETVVPVKKRIGRPPNPNKKSRRKPKPEHHIYFVGIDQDTTKWSNKYFMGNIVVKTPNHPRKGVVWFKKYYGYDIDYHDIKNYEIVFKFYKQAMEDILKEDPKAEFMFYDQLCRGHFSISSINNICVNNFGVVDMLSNKYFSRAMLKRDINLVEYKGLYKYEITPKILDIKFKNPHFERFVIQEPFGFGGSGTYLMDRINYTRLRLHLKERCEYAVCGYIEDCIPVNVHFMINPHNVIIFDGSVQKTRITHHILYNGWDFDKFESLSESVKQKIYDSVKRFVPRLQHDGYIGVGGADFIVDKNENVYFMEINPRFQLSSEGLDKRLQTRGFPSFYHINYMCFYEQDQFAKLAKQLSH